MNSKPRISSVLSVSLCLNLLFFLLPACQKLSRLAIAEDPFLAQEHLSRAAGYAQAGDWESAQAEYERATRLDERNPAAWLGLGNARRALGKPRPALKCYAKAHELSPGDAEALNQLALGYLELGKLEPALSAADQAVALDGTNLPYYLSTRGRVKLGQGDRAGAAQDLRAALLQAPEEAEPLRQEIAELLKEAEAAP